jgi:hypothetical protein
MIILPLMARKVRIKGVSFGYALYIVVIIVDSLWNEEILEQLALKNRMENSSVFGGDSRTSSIALNSILNAMEAVSSRNNNNRLVVLPNEA